MTPDEIDKRVRKVLALMKPDAARRKWLREDVEDALARLELANTNNWASRQPGRKDAKKAAQRLANALRGVRSALNSEHLGLEILWTLPKREAFNDWIDTCDRLAREKSEKPRPVSDAKMRAASLARELIIKHGRKPTASRNGLFCKVAAAIYVPQVGERGGDLQHQCREVLKQWR